MDSRVRDIFRAALDNTVSGKLRWTTFDPEAFWTKIGSGRIHFQRVGAEAAAGATIYEAQVTDDVGRIVAEVEEREGSADFPLLDKLFQAVRPAAPNSDRVLDDMLQALKASA